MIAALIGLASELPALQVDGKGFLRFLSKGRIVYARSAKLEIIDGRVCRSSGEPLMPALFAAQAADVRIDEAGNITIDGTGRGRLTLAVFAESAVLEGDGPLLTSADRPGLAYPGQGAGLLKLAAQGSPSVPAPKRQPKEQPAAGRPRIEVRSESAVSGERFTLGEIAKIDSRSEVGARLGAVALGESPAIGVARGMDRTRIEARLRAAGLDPAQFDISIPQGARVRRESAQVTPEEIERVARAEITAKLGSNENFKLRDLASRPIELPPGDFSVRAEDLRFDSTSLSVSVSIYQGDRRVNGRTLVFVPVDGVRIASGATVKLLISANGARVQTTGRAKGSGLRGQQIEVIAEGGAVLTGVVTGPGTVEVKL